MTAQICITSAPDGGFDLTTGKEYIILYGTGKVVEKMGDRISQNHNPDGIGSRYSLQGE